jgi:ribulose-5-phosphate 4-epimerase/fuculose-1-phosphate aldolase
MEDDVAESTPYANRSIDELKEAIVLGLRVATREGIMDHAGHLTMRVPGENAFLINPRFSPSIAEPEDIATVDLKTGKQLDGPHPIPSESIIHRAILNARPDVNSIMHFHSRFLVLLGTLEIELRPIARDDHFFESGVPVLDNADNVDNEALADEMVEALGPHRAMLLRGHGSVVTGVHPESATMAALQLEVLANNVYESHLLGRPDPRPVVQTPRGDADKGVLSREGHYENPYRRWPYLLEKHNLLPRERIRQMLSSPTYKG